MIFNVIYGEVARFVTAGPAWVVTMLITFVLVFAITALVPIFLGWVERKYSARIQSRYGPVYVGPFGLLQNFADIMKLIGKRAISTNVDRLPYEFVPIVLATLSFAMVLIIPFGGANLEFISVPYSLLFLYVFLAVSPLLVLMAGWGENNKYAMLGGFRGVGQIATYELALIVTMISVAFLAGSYNIVDIVNGQSGLWYGAYLPVTLIVFALTGLAIIERAPFDIPEASQELQAGWKVEYSGIRYGLFLIADYVRLMIVSILVVYLFLGGWLGPVLPGFVWFIIKTAAVLLIIMAPRWTLPRPRIDQFIKFGWNWLLPLSIVNLVMVGGLLLI